MSKKSTNTNDSQISTVQDSSVSGNAAVASGRGSIQGSTVLSGNGASLNMSTTDFGAISAAFDSTNKNTGAAFDFASGANAQAAASLQSSAALAQQSAAAGAALASSVVNQTGALQKQNLEFVESTRAGNQAIAADLAQKAFDLAEKRTGSESDQAFSAGRVFLYVILAAIGIIFFSRKLK